jgi:hypothetical protein
MGSMSNTTCPICSNTNLESIYNIPCDRFDNSLLYQTIKLVSCIKCGHVFNYLTEIELDNLNQYYNGEYKNCNESSTTKRMDSIRKEQLSFFLNNYNSVKIVDQSLEHISNLNTAFNCDEQYLCIGVPDASEYSLYKFFEPYWIIMREHIQHFDSAHLVLLAELQGFEIEKILKDSMPIMSEVMQMPVLTILFKHSSSKPYSIFNCKNNLFLLKNTIYDYVNTSIVKLEKAIKKIPKDKIVYFWGIGREFLFVNKFFNNFPYKILVDNNKYKQEMLTINNLKIYNEDALEDIKDNSVVITATAHRELLKSKLLKTNFKGRIFDI